MSLQPPPQVSPDGKFFWNGSAWIPMPAAPSSRPSRGGSAGVTATVVVVVFVVVVAISTLSQCGSGLTVTVRTWASDSPDVAGTIANSHSACSDPEITLHLRDHNGAIVRDFTFGAGELAQGQTRSWSTHMVSFLSDAPVEPNVIAVDADAVCADQH